MSEQASDSVAKRFFITRRKLNRATTDDPNRNIFHSPDPATQEKEDQSDMLAHHILGDRQFKQKLLLTKTIERRSQSEAASAPHNRSATVGNLQFMDTTGRLTVKHQSRLLQLSQLNFLERDQKTMEHFANMTDNWNKFQRKTKKQLKRKQRTPPKVRLFAQNNPEKEEIVKQLGLQYWQMSLRNNNKQLLKHLDAVPVSKADFLRHMQTTKGRLQLQKSIPKINQRTSEGFSLDGKRKKVEYFDSMLSTLQEVAQPEEVLTCNWRNKNLSRVYQQYAT